MSRIAKEIDTKSLIHKYVKEGQTLKELEAIFHTGHKRLAKILRDNNIEITPGYKVQNIEGKKFGNLTALEVVGERQYKKRKDRLWRCKCDCGNEVVVTQYCLLKGTSCGCRKKRLAIASSTTHGGHETKLYGVWQTMKNRCFNQNTKSYTNYGGRGISVCDEWKDDFGVFQSWANANGYKEGLTIDRIDNNGNYEPSNCRWVTVLEQSHNKRNNRYVEYKGNRYTLSEFGRLIGIDRRTIGDRLKRGLSVEEAIIPRRKGYNGTQKDWV